VLSLHGNKWDFYNPTNIIFGPGSFDRLTEYVQYERVILVTSKTFRSNGVADKVAKIFEERLVYVLDDVITNPDLQLLDKQLSLIRSKNADLIISLGGGSCIDTAKALAFMLSSSKEFSLNLYLADQSFFSRNKSLPIIAIPTTSGTGSEVTPFATVWDFAGYKKHSIYSNDIYPNTAILDPELTYYLPKDITISSGLDAVSHALESVWNKNANPITLALASKSLSMSLPSIRKLKQSLNNHEARADMMQASLLAGLAISRTRTALAHSISYPLTTDFAMPHGIASSFTLSSVLKFNLAVDDGRLENLAKHLGYKTPSDMANDIDILMSELSVNDVFFRYAPNFKSVTNLVERMYDPARANNNIRKATTQDIFTIIFSSLNQV
jgi:phosphonate metabolism-associated iron-containing alcohol dehydrogenase